MTSSDWGFRTRRRVVFALGIGLWSEWAASQGVSTSTSASSGATIFTPFDFGAVGNGMVDDTAAVQRALDKAQQAGGEVYFPPGVFAISQYIVVRNGVRRLVGKGGKLRCIGSAQNTGILLTGIALKDKENVENCRIEGMLIDANWRTTPVNAIHATNSRRCEFIGNRITNMRSGTGILVQSQSDGKDPAAELLIDDNTIEGDIGVPGTAWWGIRVHAERQFDSGAKTQPEQWKTRFVAADSPLPVSGCTVRNNRINGGYYGVSLSSARYCSVVDNKFQNNVRNISVQDCSQNNKIIGNHCSESLSSGIHLAYGSRRNLIGRNSILTSRAVGQGLLQAYVGTEDNQFIGNDVTSNGRSKYIIYCGVHAHGNVFKDNQLRGNAERAYAAFESGFSSTLNNPAHYGYKESAPVDGFAHTGSSHNALVGNIIDGIGSAPAIFLCQVGPAAVSLKSTVIANNRILTNRHRSQLELFEQSLGALSETELTGNTFASEADRSKFIIPRGLAHFSKASDNGRSFDHWFGRTI